MKSIQQSLMSMLKEHSAKRYLSAAVGMIAIATVLAVVWSLHINGITLASDDPTCGLQEHEHTAACYDWVMLDGTEEIDVTEGTEAAESVEGTEAVETTETAETVAADTETEAVAAGVSVSAENTEASESASGDTEDGMEAENNDTENGTDGASVSTESVFGDTEEGTESLTEDATEDATEGLTEEATESPQLGDTKVVDGVTYIYELVCELEEHVHTDDCYLVESSEDSVDNAENTSGSEDSADGSTSEHTADGTDSEDSSDEVTDDEEIISSTTTRLMATSSEEEESEEDTDSGIAIISEEEEEATVTLTSNANSSTEAYSFADSTTLVDAAGEEGESYIVYTIIDGTYYVVSAVDGSLLKCIDLSGYVTTDEKVSNSTNTGIYVWEFDSVTNEPVFRFTTDTSVDDFADYLWNVTSASALETDGSGDYILYNEENDCYLASGIVTYSDTYETTNATVAGHEVPMTGNGSIVYSVTFSAFRYSGRVAQFYFDVYDASGNKIDIYVRYDNYYTGSITNQLSVTSADGSTYSSYTYGTLSISTDDVYEITVVRDDSNVCIYIYNTTQDEMCVYVVDGLNLDSTIYSQLTVYNGVFSSSANVFAISSSNENGTSIANASEADGSYTVASGINQISDTVKTISGDFDVTYTFTNKSNGTYDYENFVIELNNNAGVYITFLANNNGWLAYNSDSTDVFEIFTSFSDWTSWNSTMASGTSCTARVIRKGNTFLLITTSAGHTSVAYAEVSEFDGTVANVYLAGENCTISNITYTDNTAKEYIYSVVSSNSDPVTLTVDFMDAYVWTVDDIGSSNENIYLQGSVSGSSASLTWMTGTASAAGAASGTSTTFSVARVRQCKVYFDGTNGGGTVYRESTSAVHHVDVVSYEMDAEGTKFYVTVPSLSYTPYYANSGYYYDYDLIGWYDIYNSSSDNDAISLSDISSIVNENYYEPGDTMELAYDSSSTGATITVCYADYIGTTYDAAIDPSTDAAYSDGLLTDRASSSDGTGGVNTNNFVTTYVYDYSDIFNLYSAYIDSSGASVTTSNNVTTTTYKTLSGHQELWRLGSIVSGDPLTLGTSIFGSNVSYGFIFFNNAATENSSLYYLNRGTNYANFNGGNTYIRIADITTTLSALSVDLRSILFPDPNTTSGGAWHTLSSSNGTITDTVNKSGTMGTTYVGEGNYLYQYNEDTGYYYYDAADNAAFYSITDQRFYLYDYTVRMYKSGSSAASTSDFLPFNYAAATYTGTDEDGNTYVYGQIDYTQINYAFGMKSEIEFVLPDDVPYKDETVTSDVNQNLGRDMKFCFMGDDDLWVYIDEGTSDEILLDIGGIHGEIYGEINFSTGIVGVVDYLSETITISSDGVITCGHSSYSYTMTEKQKVTYKDLLGTTTEGIEIFIEKTDENLYEITDLAKSISWVYTETYIATNQASALASGEHVLSVYYMERGASESNLAMYFNLSPTYDLQLLKADATVASTLGSSATIADLIVANGAMLQDAAFKIYEASSLSGFSSSGYSTLKEYLEYLATTSSGSVVGTYYTDDDTNYSVNGTTADGEDYQVIVNSLRQEHTYYIVETQAPANYPLSGKVVALYMANNGDVTVTVYGSTGTVLETYFYDYSEQTVTATSSSGTSFVYGSGILVTFDSLTDDIILAMAILNAYDYELPSTGSTGLFPYERAGAILVSVAILGLLMMALSELVQRRRMRMNAYKRGYNEEKAGRENRYAGTRDRPQQRNRIYGRDASASFSDGSQERSRGTGPGTK